MATQISEIIISKIKMRTTIGEEKINGPTRSSSQPSMPLRKKLSSNTKIKKRIKIITITYISWARGKIITWDQ
jgi:hypothetical protein